MMTSVIYFTLVRITKWYCCQWPVFMTAADFEAASCPVAEMKYKS